MSDDNDILKQYEKYVEKIKNYMDNIKKEKDKKQSIIDENKKKPLKYMREQGFSTSIEIIQGIDKDIYKNTENVEKKREKMIRFAKKNKETLKKYDILLRRDCDKCKKDNININIFYDWIVCSLDINEFYNNFLANNKITKNVVSALVQREIYINKKIEEIIFDDIYTIFKCRVICMKLDDKKIKKPMLTYGNIINDLICKSLTGEYDKKTLDTFINIIKCCSKNVKIIKEAFIMLFEQTFDKDDNTNFDKDIFIDAHVNNKIKDHGDNIISTPYKSLIKQIPITPIENIYNCLRINIQRRDPINISRKFLKDVKDAMSESQINLKFDRNPIVYMIDLFDEKDVIEQNMFIFSLYNYQDILNNSVEVYNFLKTQLNEYVSTKDHKDRDNIKQESLIKMKNYGFFNTDQKGIISDKWYTDLLYNETINEDLTKSIKIFKFINENKLFEHYLYFGLDDQKKKNNQVA